MEIFFSSIYLRIGQSGVSTVEQQQLVLECLVEFCTEPDLIVGLYRNYDLETGSTSLFEDLMRFLSNLASSSSTPHAVSISSMEAVLAVIESIRFRFCLSPEEEERIDSSYEPRDGTESGRESTELTKEEEAELARKRQKKKQLNWARKRFNKDGAKSFGYLQGIQILPDPITGESLGEFLRTTRGLDKTKMGEILGGSDELSQAALANFSEYFDFKALQPDDNLLEIDVALRGFMDAFRLPGEAQQISRIMEAFAAAFFKYNKGHLASSDAAYVLAFAAMMLHTDAHNPNIKEERRMTVEAFKKNVRGINDGQDLPDDYIRMLYDNITTTEIKMTADGEWVTQQGGAFQSRWRGLLRSSNAQGTFQTAAAKSHGKEMFMLFRENFLHLCARYLEPSSLPGSMLRSYDMPLESDDDHDDRADLSSSAIKNDPSRRVGGLYGMSELKSDAFSLQKEELTKLLPKLEQACHSFARICAVYTLYGTFNNLMVTLANALVGHLEEFEEDPSGFSPRAAFGRSEQAILLTRVISSLSLQYGHTMLLEGWSNVVLALLWLQRLDLLPDTMSDLQDIHDRSGARLMSIRDPSFMSDAMGRASALPGADTIGQEGAGGLTSLLSSAFSLFFTAGEESAMSPVIDKKEVRTSTSLAEPDIQGLERSKSSLSSSSLSSSSTFPSGGADDGSSVASASDMSEAALVERAEESAQLKAVEVVKACKWSQLFGKNSQFLQPQSFTFLFKALLACSFYNHGKGDAHLEDFSGIEKKNQDGTGFDSGSVFDKGVLSEDGSVFCLERLGDLIEHNQHRIFPSPHTSQASLSQDVGESVSSSPSCRPLPSSISSSKDGDTTSYSQPMGAHPTFASGQLQGVLLHQYNRVLIRGALNFHFERTIVHIFLLNRRLQCNLPTTKFLLLSLSRLSESTPEPALRMVSERVTAGLRDFLQTRGHLLVSSADWAILFRSVHIFCL